MLPRSWAVLALVLFAGCCGIAVLGSGDRGSYDFQAFYCAGAALRAQADPYRAQPLGACEHRQTDGTYAALASGVVLPAPQPGYDIAAFAPLSLLAFPSARAIWGALLAMTIAVALLCLIRVTGESAPVVLTALAASLILPSLAFGELFALFAAAACAAMLFAQQGRWNAAAIAAAASLVEPHLGLPLCLCLAIWKAPARIPLVLCVSLLGIASAVALGAAQNVEYVTAVLPLHALSELNSDTQLSAAAIFYGLHVPALAALRLGALSYVFFAACGIVLAKVLARRFASDAFLVAVPAAFAAIGGTFMHVTEVFAAIPLALLLMARAPHYRMPLLVTVVLLAVPWIAGIERGNAAAFATLGALVVAVLAWDAAASRKMLALAAAAATFAILIEAPQWYAHAALGAHPALAGPPIDPAYAQASWQAWSGATLSSGSAVAWLLRVPTWIGLVLLAALAARVSRPEPVWSPAPAQATPSAR